MNSTSTATSAIAAAVSAVFLSMRIAIPSLPALPVRLNGVGTPRRPDFPLQPRGDEMADMHGAQAPASADERIEEFAEFLDTLDAQDDVRPDQRPAGAEPANEPPALSADADHEDTLLPAGDPATTPPVSWDNDARALFAQLPPELQTKVAEREAQRDRALQSATTAAAEARRNAAVEAQATFADQQRLYAEHLEQIAAQYMPQRPDPALLAQDPQQFYELQALYEMQSAQNQAMTQQAYQAQAEAQQRDAFVQAQELAQDHAILGAELGEDWTDTTRRAALLTDLEQVGAALGYSMELMGQASAGDILALNAAAEWKAKAERYDALQDNRMTAVAPARNAPRSAKPGVSATRAERLAHGRDAAWARAKTERSGDAYAALLDGMGISL